MLEILRSLHGKFLPTMTNSSKESFSTYPPLLNPSPNQNIPLKTSVHFQITLFLKIGRNTPKSHRILTK